MLQWLAGQKVSETANDATGLEPPETPAPVFAVRAFKHAIFGTPQTVAPPTARRHSTVEHTRPRQQGPRTVRPAMTRPKSVGNARGLEGNAEPEPMSSPTKGILMTPGTAAAKRKTVTFGDHVADKEGKRTQKSGLPDDCPGKFPSPWAKSSADDEAAEHPSARGRGKSKLTEALEQARDESEKRSKSVQQRAGGERPEIDNAVAGSELETHTASYWKTEYDVYRENTTREVKQLIKKQKLAKSFAKQKDFECTDLADQLRQEQKKVARLEKRTAELELQLQEMQTKVIIEDRLGAAEPVLRKEPTAEATLEPAYAKKDIAMPKGVKREHIEPKLAEIDGLNVYARSLARKSTLAQNTNRRTSTERLQDAQNAQPTRQPLQDIATTSAHLFGTAKPPDMKADLSRPALAAKRPTSADAELSKPQTKTRPEAGRSNTADDIWAQSFASSSPIVMRATSPTRGARAVTSGTGATPLKSLSINTLPNAKLTRRDSAQPSPPIDAASVSASASAPRIEDRHKQSPAPSPALPQPSPEAQRTLARPAPKPSVTRSAVVGATEDLSMPIPLSSPFQPTVTSPIATETARPVASSRPSGPRGAKENVSPTRAPQIAQVASELNVKPSAAWAAINVPHTGKRVPSLVDKSGKEVEAERIEAAKKRIEARRAAS